MHSDGWEMEVEEEESLDVESEGKHQSVDQQSFPRSLARPGHPSIHPAINLTLQLLQNPDLTHGESRGKSGASFGQWARWLANISFL